MIISNENRKNAYNKVNYGLWLKILRYRYGCFKQVGSAGHHHAGMILLTDDHFEIW